MSDYPDLDKYAIPGLTDEDRDRFLKALEDDDDAVNVLPLLRLTPLHPLDADPPIDENAKATSEVTVS